MHEKFQYRLGPERFTSNECVNIFIIQIEYTANKNRQTLSQPKPWCIEFTPQLLHHDNDVKDVVSS